MFEMERVCCNVYFCSSQCNNPQTKEPKLERAIRIAPEWTEYDDVIRKLQEQMNSEETKKSKFENHIFFKFLV